MILTKIKHTAERLSHADRPGNGHALQLEHGFDFAEQIQRVAHFTIKLVDESDDRRVAHAADIQKLDRLSFDALGRVNDHDGGVYGRENTIRILGEVLVARRVEQIDDVILVFELASRNSLPRCRAAFPLPSSRLWHGAQPLRPLTAPAI